MTYKAKVAVCSESRTKHSTQSEHNVKFLKFKPWPYIKKPTGFNPFQSNFPANSILPSSYSFWAVKRLVDYL
jgi:hypothetical protein